jgi:hypothetical protein
MKIKGPFMKVMLLNEAIKYIFSNQNSKLKHVIIQFKLYNIHNTTYHD